MLNYSAGAPNVHLFVLNPHLVVAGWVFSCTEIPNSTNLHHSASWVASFFRSAPFLFSAQIIPCISSPSSSIMAITPDPDHWIMAIHGYPWLTQTAQQCSALRCKQRPHGRVILRFRRTCFLMEWRYAEETFRAISR